jgi:tRNA(Ile)-lysidine synthase
VGGRLDPAVARIRAEVRAALSDLTDASPGGLVLVGFSGGADSLALLAATCFEAPKAGLSAGAVVVDHGLQPGSADVAARAAAQAATLGAAPVRVERVDVGSRGGPEAAARTARHAAVSRVADELGAVCVLLAHTRDDQAETVLHRLARGSGLAGLAGIARLSRRDGLTLVRPCLGIAKARLVATLRAARIPYAEDPSNQDPRFLRPRLRRLMPALAVEGLDAARLAGFAQRAARANAAIEAAVDEAVARLATVAEHGLTIDAGHDGELPTEVALRLLGRAIDRAGDEGPVELGKLEALAAALEQASNRRSARFRRTLAGALVTLREGRLTVERAPPRRFQRGRKVP